MRADAERGVRDIPRGQGCQLREKSENGAENHQRECCAEIVFTRPGNGLENQAFVPTCSTWQVVMVFSRPIGLPLDWALTRGARWDHPSAAVKPLIGR
jgi:hypothetical protein